MEDGIVEKVYEICLYFVIVQKTNVRNPLCSVKHTPKKIMWRSLDFVPLFKVFIYFPRHMMYDVFR